MKRNRTPELLAVLTGVLLLILMSLGRAQIIARLEPTGFLPLTITGASSNGVEGTSYLGLGLTRPVEYRGTATGVSGNTLTDSSANWSSGKFNGSNGAYFVEITSINGSNSAAGVGTTYAITGTSGSTLTLANNLAAGVNPPAGYKIRKQWTIAAVFGTADESGLLSGTENTADLVQLWNGTALDSYYYSGSGWRKTGDSATDAGGTVIPFAHAIVVKRRTNGTVTLSLNGAVKPGLTSIPVSAGDNYVGNVYPAQLALATCGLYTGNSATGLVAGTADSADAVLIWNGNAFDTYFYQTLGSGGAGWRSTSDASTDAGGTIIPAGSGFVIRRKAASSFNWIVPETLTAAAVPLTGKLLNLSTRGLVQTGDNVLIGGFIVTGSEAKRVAIRAIGPSLASAGLADALADPLLEVHDSSGAIIMTNDNWKDDPRASELQSSGLAPQNAAESATVLDLTPANYTVIVRGTNESNGVGLVEIFDLNRDANAQLANLSTRGKVGTGDDALIAGFIINGNGATVIIRACGPSLASDGVSGVLADPTLEVHDSNGTLTASNDNWQTDAGAAEIQTNNLAPTDAREAATLQSLAAGAHTVVVRGAGNSTGVALVEVYRVE